MGLRIATVAILIAGTPLFAMAQSNAGVPTAPQSRQDALNAGTIATPPPGPINRRLQPLPYQVPEGVSTTIGSTSSLSLNDAPATRVTVPQSTRQPVSSPSETDTSGLYPRKNTQEGGRRIICDDGPLLGGLTGGHVKCRPEGTAPGAKIVNVSEAKPRETGLLRVHKSGVVSYTEPSPEYGNTSVVYDTFAPTDRVAPPEVVTVGDTRVVEAPHAFRPLRREKPIQ